MRQKGLFWIGKAAGLAAVLSVGLLLAPLPARAQEVDSTAQKAENKAAISEEAARVHREDGEYTVEVTLAGGSGRAAIVSPAVLLVKDGQALARIEWGSSSYDYMKVGNEIYFPVNTEGNSVFEIPVPVFDEGMAVIADTTAMSVPHEISYTLTFHLDSIEKAKSGAGFPAILSMICLAAAGTAGVLIYKRKR